MCRRRQHLEATNLKRAEPINKMPILHLSLRSLTKIQDPGLRSIFGNVPLLEWYIVWVSILNVHQFLHCFHNDSVLVHRKTLRQ
jgi:hypothetical protein